MARQPHRRRRPGDRRALSRTPRRILRRMERDLRETPLYQEIEAAYRRLAEPGFGRVTAASDVRASPDGSDGRVPRRAARCARGARRAAASAWRRRTARACARSRTAPTRTPARAGRPTARRSRSSRTAARPARRSSTRSRPACSARRASSPRRPGIVEHHEWSPDGTRILLLVAGHGAEQTDALGSGTLGAQAELPDVDAARRLERGRGRAAPRALRPRRRERRARGRPRPTERQRLGGGLVRDGAHRRDRLRGRRRGRLVRRRARADRPGSAHRAHAAAHARCSSAGSPRSPGGTHAAVVEAVCSDRVIVAGELLLIDPASGEAARSTPHGVDVTLDGLARRRAPARDRRARPRAGRARRRRGRRRGDGDLGRRRGCGGGHLPGGLAGRAPARAFAAVVEAWDRAPAVVLVDGDDDADAGRPRRTPARRRAAS